MLNNRPRTKTFMARQVLRGRLPPELSDDDSPSFFDAAATGLASTLRWLREYSGLMAGSGLSEGTVQVSPPRSLMLMSAVSIIGDLFVS